MVIQNEPKQSIFDSVFDVPCKDLPPVFQKHYDLKAFADEQQSVTGSLTIKTHGVLKLLRPIYRLLGALPFVTTDEVPVTVDFKSTSDNNVFQFNRTFQFTDRKHYCFNSLMYPVANQEFYEVMRYGMSWRFTLSYENNTVTYHHRGYGFKFFNTFIPLPISWLVGKGSGQEVMVNDDQFDMNIKLTHPLFGLLYTYYGCFTFVHHDH